MVSNETRTLGSRACGWIRGDSLFFGNALRRHALARVADLGHDILADDVAGAHDARANGNGRAVPTEPSPHRGDHVCGGSAGRVYTGLCV